MNRIYHISFPKSLLSDFERDSFKLFYPSTHLRDEVSEFFDRMDRDYDGRLSFGEFMGEETPLEKVFKNMDKDGDGTVSKEVSSVAPENAIVKDKF